MLHTPPHDVSFEMQSRCEAESSDLRELVAEAVCDVARIRILGDRRVLVDRGQRRPSLLAIRSRATSTSPAMMLGRHSAASGQGLGHAEALHHALGGGLDLAEAAYARSVPADELQRTSTMPQRRRGSGTASALPEGAVHESLPATAYAPRRFGARGGGERQEECRSGVSQIFIGPFRPRVSPDAQFLPSAAERGAASRLSHLDLSSRSLAVNAARLMLQL